MQACSMSTSGTLITAHAARMPDTHLHGWLLALSRPLITARGRIADLRAICSKQVCQVTELRTRRSDDLLTGAVRGPRQSCMCKPCMCKVQNSAYSSHAEPLPESAVRSRSGIIRSVLCTCSIIISQAHRSGCSGATSPTIPAFQWAMLEPQRNGVQLVC